MEKSKSTRFLGGKHSEKGRSFVGSDWKETVREDTAAKRGALFRWFRRETKTKKIETFFGKPQRNEALYFVGSDGTKRESTRFFGKTQGNGQGNGALYVVGSEGKQKSTRLWARHSKTGRPISLVQTELFFVIDTFFGENTAKRGALFRWFRRKQNIN